MLDLPWPKHIYDLSELTEGLSQLSCALQLETEQHRLWHVYVIRV